jgi:thioesterase domain-containing protein
MSLQYSTNARETPAPPAIDPADAAELAAFLRAEIPLAVAMQLTVHADPDGCGLWLEAPLSPNRNDKGSAFGGATASLLTLACWGWLWLANRAAGVPGDIVIGRAELDYRAPVHEPLRAVCAGPDPAAWSAYLERVRARGQARLDLDGVLRREDGTLATTMRARYVTLRPKP